MRKIGSLSSVIKVSGTDGLLSKASFYIILNMAVFGFSFVLAQLAGVRLLYGCMAMLMSAFTYYTVNKNGQALQSLKEYSRKVETDLEKEVGSGQNKSIFIRNAYHQIK